MKKKYFIYVMIAFLILLFFWNNIIFWYASKVKVSNIEELVIKLANKEEFIDKSIQISRLSYNRGYILLDNSNKNQYIIDKLIEYDKTRVGIDEKIFCYYFLIKKSKEKKYSSKLFELILDTSNNQYRNYSFAKMTFFKLILDSYGKDLYEYYPDGIDSPINLSLEKFNELLSQ